MPVGAARAIAVALLLLGAGLAGAEETAPEVPTRLADCDALIRDEPERLESYRCYWFVARNRDRLHEAARRLESLLQLDPANPHIQLILGAVASDLGQDRAEDLNRQALEGYVAGEDARGEIYSRISLAVILRKRGLTEESSAQLQRALARAVEVGDAALEAQVRVSLGWQKYHERDYGEAWELLTKAEGLVFPEGSIHEQLGTLDGLAAVCWALGRESDALGYYRRMIELMQGTDPYRESDIRRNMALMAKNLVAAGRLDPEELIRLQREALDAAIRSGNPYAEIGARLMLAGSLPGPEGLEQARVALDTARRIKKLNDTCWALGFIAERSLRLAPQDPRPAFAAVEEAIELARSRGDPEWLARGLEVRAGMRWITGPRELAIEESFAALDAIEGIRDLQPDGEVRARVFGRFAESYRELADAFLSAEDGFEQAFTTMERMRARSLLDTLDAAGVTAAIAPSGLLPDARSEVLEEIAAVRAKLQRVDLPPEERSRLRERLSELEVREASLRGEIAAAEPGFAALRGASIPPLEELRRGLDEDQALIAFLIDDRRRENDSTSHSRSWAMVVSSGGVRAARLPHCAELRRKVRLFLSLLERKDGSEQTGARRLYADLLGESLSVLPEGVTRLVVIPDGPLHRLPFGALIDPGGGSFLAERYAVSIVPSAATWLRWRRSESERARATVLAFADPELPPDSAAEVRGGLGPLPYARREAGMLLRNLGADGRVLVGAEASEGALKQAGPEAFRMLHFASHAVVNDEHPDRSAVVLAAGPAGDAEDGLLRFKEVVTLDLDGQVVLLSACRSASGPLIGGEGMMGLANAFFQAGARTVIAGLWPVRDRETSLLIDRFGRHLSAGNSVSTALALARRDLLERGLPPAAWASMIVLGDGDHVPFPDQPSRRWNWRTTAVVTLVVCALLAALALRRHLRRVHVDRAGHRRG